MLFLQKKDLKSQYRLIPVGIKSENDWVAFKVAGTLNFLSLEF